MYINWAHHYFPKVNAIISFFINSVLIYVVHSDRKIKLGNYRFLLLFFAIFNLFSTCGDCLVPMSVFNYKHSFSVFVTEGIFETRSLIGTVFLTICFDFLGADDERRAYMANSYLETYKVDVFDLNILISKYEGNDEAEFKSRVGIISLTLISLISFISDIIMGSMITNNLRKSTKTMSKKTKRLQKQFMKTLWVQITVPLFGNFIPAIFAWYRPIFDISAPPWIDTVDTVATSFFAVLDPLALFYFIPAFRNRIKEIFRISRVTEENLSSRPKVTVKAIT